MIIPSSLYSAFFSWTCFLIVLNSGHTRTVFHHFYPSWRTILFFSYVFILRTNRHSTLADINNTKKGGGKCYFLLLVMGTCVCSVVCCRRRGGRCLCCATACSLVVRAVSWKVEGVLNFFHWGHCTLRFLAFWTLWLLLDRECCFHCTYFQRKVSRSSISNKMAQASEEQDGVWACEVDCQLGGRWSFKHVWVPTPKPLDAEHCHV